MYRWLICSLALVIIACQSKPALTFSHSIQLGEVKPLGLYVRQDSIWISDSDNNTLNLVDNEGKLIKRIEGLDRPMHITLRQNDIYVPSYGANAIIITDMNGEFDTLRVGEPLDAPAGISLEGQQIAIADFYNHRVLYYNANEWIIIGAEGDAPKQFYYPTDVQLFKGQLFVADAYNNRVQVFSDKGEFIRIIGDQDMLNAATGIYVDDNGVFITDFENDRVMIYAHEGQLLQTIEGNISKPTDIIASDGKYYIANYGDNTVAVYQ